MLNLPPSVRRALSALAVLTLTLITIIKISVRDESEHQTEDWLNIQQERLDLLDQGCQELAEKGIKFKEYHKVRAFWCVLCMHYLFVSHTSYLCVSR